MPWIYIKLLKIKFNKCIYRFKRKNMKIKNHTMNAVKNKITVC